MPFVYILKNEKGKYYIGSTINLTKRFKQHINGLSPYTKKLGKLSLVFSQEYKNIKDARFIEYKLKRLKRHDFIDKIIKDGFIKIKLKNNAEVAQLAERSPEEG